MTARPQHPGQIARPGGELIGLGALCCALVFNVLALRPELWIGKLPPNDAVFHLAAAERLADSLTHGEPFLDPWVSEWSLGYPLWRSYQPLPHLVAAGVLWLTESFTDHATAFAALQYGLQVLLPFSVYAGARLLGLAPFGAGLAALLTLAPAGTGDLGRYGLGYAATVWRGSGLYTQLVALHFLVLSLGAVTRALDRGRSRATAVLLMAATALSHIIFGYVALVSAVLLAIIGPNDERARRLVRLATIIVPAFFLLAWFAVPLLLTSGEVNHSRWEPEYKWNSFGASFILEELLSGRLLDAGRSPTLSLLAAVGSLAAVLSLRDVLARRLLALTALWLALFCGRETWGHLLVLVGVPADFHLHRLQAAFELSAFLLAAWGIDRMLWATAARSRVLLLATVSGLLAALLCLGVERAHYLEENARWGEQSLGAYERERADLDAALAEVNRILAERPGRASAGKAATWGGQFKVGSAPVYGFLTRAHVDQVSFLYHAMSLTSDVMVLRDEADAGHDTAFGVRAVIAPSTWAAPAHLRRRGQYGRFDVYESSSEGYFGLVDIGARYTGPPSTFYEPNAAWLRSSWLREGIVLALGERVPGVPSVGRWEAFPPLAASLRTARGRILEEAKDGETYRARLLLERPCDVLLKITWYPDLVATVDGHPVRPLRVTPGFAAVPVSAGEHEVEVRYAPSPLKPSLLIVGAVLFLTAMPLLRSVATSAAEDAMVQRLSRCGERLATPQVVSALALLVFVLLAMRPLFRGQLIDGHDALCYPPRLVEMCRVLRDGQIPPVWAPDLGSGYGQPLFEFLPPLLYVAAVPFSLAGARLADSLQFALAGLFAAGATAVYLIGRRAQASRPAAVAGAATWLFAPYVAVDLYVRAAFAEAAAMAVAPVALLGLLIAMDRPSSARIGAAAALVALVPLAHHPVALLVLPAFALVILAQRSWRARLCGALVLGLALGLSAFFWVPALVEQQFVKTHFLREGFAQWSRHAISPFQLLWSPWGFGYSVPGPADGMSFALGPVHLVLAAAGLVLVLRAGDRRRQAEAIAYVIAAVGGAWLATEWSAPVWSRVETLQYLALPWRALLLPALFLPLLAVPVFESLPTGGLCAVILILLLANLPHIATKGFLTFDDEYYAPASLAEKGINTLTYEEFEPRWVSRRPGYTSQRLTGLTAVRPLALESAHQEFAVSATADTVAEAATFYYPGWTVRVDGQDVPVEPVPDRGTISFHVAPGEHTVTLDLRPTAVRHAATLVSLAVAAILGLIAAAALVRQAQRCRTTHVIHGQRSSDGR